MAGVTPPQVVLFGYDSSPFTQKVRMVLKAKQILYTFVLVPSMLPRPILVQNFGITYRKIPVLAIDRDFYIDTSLIIEALEYHPSFQNTTIYPEPRLRPLIRGFASYWTDRPLFRVTTGLIPSAVWRTNFGKDRAGLIGHPLDPDKLEAKIPRNLAGLEMHFSMLEPLFEGRTEEKPWMFDGLQPSLADISLYYQLKWGKEISQGQGIQDLTGGGTDELRLEGMEKVFTKERFPALYAWYGRLKACFDGLENVEKQKIFKGDDSGAEEVVKMLEKSKMSSEIPMVPTPVQWNKELDAKSGVSIGTKVSVAPDDTGRDDPVIGELLAVSAEEVVVRPAGEKRFDSRVHIPRLGFIVRPLGKESRL